MKLYKITLHEGPDQFVPADDYQLIDGEYRFFANGAPFSESFFVASAVRGVTVDNENYISPDENWRRLQELQDPEPTYPDPVDDQ
jgi:hypothetical protein